MPQQLYQRVYLSPHLDDAALSCGGRIYQERQAGLSVLVLNLSLYRSHADRLPASP